MDKTKPATSFKAVGSTPASASTSKFDQPAKEGIESDGNSPPSFPSIPDNDGCALTAADLTPRELEVEAAIAASLKGKGKDATPVTEEKFGSEDAEGEDDPEVLDEMQEISSNDPSSEPDDEYDDPSWTAGQSSKVAKTVKATTATKPHRKLPAKHKKDMKPSFGKTTPRGHRKFNIPSHLKQKGSRKTRELERRLAELEKAMGKAADKEESPVEIVKARGQMSKRGRFVEYESPTADRKVCKECYEMENLCLQHLGVNCHKHPWWVMLDEGACVTCGNQRYKVIHGIKKLQEAGIMGVDDAHGADDPTAGMIEEDSM